MISLVEIIGKKENPLYSRTDVVASAHVEGATPSRQNVASELAKTLGAKPDCVVIRSITQEFGSKSARIEASAYTSKEMLEKYEANKYLSERGKKKAEKKEEAPAAAAPKPAAPAEKPAAA
ncbi:30S ribosomal protein S24e [Candidatus Norongarragalina meridionalis]|nr:30S ribosomal protein S24e [Candidatus Norongarragalina meridionalis]